jgi:hypothetical protein
MNLARFIGILFVFGIPTIIGGGLTFHLFHSWFAVVVWEILLWTIALTTAYKVTGKKRGAIVRKP